MPVNARSEGHVIVDGLGERVGALENHADLVAYLGGIHGRSIQIKAVEEHLAR